MNNKNHGMIVSLLAAHAWNEVREPEHGESHLNSHLTTVHAHEEPPQLERIGEEKPIAQRLRFRRFLEVRTGTPPAADSNPDTGMLLVTFSRDQALHEADQKRWTVSSEIINSGTAGYFRIKNGVGRVLFQGKISQPEQGGDMIFYSLLTRIRG